MSICQIKLWSSGVGLWVGAGADLGASAGASLQAAGNQGLWQLRAWGGIALKTTWKWKKGICYTTNNQYYKQQAKKKFIKFHL